MRRDGVGMRRRRTQRIAEFVASHDGPISQAPILRALEGGGAGFTDTVTLPPQDTNDAIFSAVIRRCRNDPRR